MTTKPAIRAEAERLYAAFLAAGAAPALAPATVLDGGIRHGVLAMESYVFGQRVSVATGEPAHA